MEKPERLAWRGGEQADIGKRPNTEQPYFGSEHRLPKRQQSRNGDQQQHHEESELQRGRKW